MSALYNSYATSPQVVGVDADEVHGDVLPPTSGLHTWAPPTAARADSNTFPTEIPSSESPDGQMPWIDRTSLDIAFDRTCFDALDDQLLHYPIDSFADLCWADAVHDTSHEPYIAMSHPPELIADADADASLSDPVHEPVEPKPSFAPAPETLPFSDKLNTPSRRLAAEPSLHPLKAKAAPAPINPRLDTLPLPPHFCLSDPSESIGFFPTRPTDRRASKPKRPSRFFAYFHFNARPVSRL
ncbi:hypothetical protein DFH07DRAFT_791790 [Mycena maculata]|uniref:Uncharacterized protein n=1 Tax=Mycena maculata TaxID=230809 RepID=A0AAD7KAW7_9AGAR|nr:hypothetical protein DFH07DRAFT_791790 [Mycena maculata]